MNFAPRLRDPGTWWMLAALVLVAAIYWPGLYGAFLFDDYPNIVDNRGVQITDAHWSSLVGAALSSPASEFKRPLASLSFAANYLAAGLAPFSWKLTNLVIHLLNGLLVFLLARALLRSLALEAELPRASQPINLEGISNPTERRIGVLAGMIAGGWMILPINLTGVLYVVQRMESLANLFVLAGLLGYVAGRHRMLTGHRGMAICIASLTLPTAIGVLAKETAVMLPLYAFLIEWLVFGFARRDGAGRHRGLLGLFAIVLLLPMLAGLAWLTPGLLRHSAWATRDFTLGTRLLSEARIVSDYVAWTLLPTPSALSFYHDDFRISSGLFAPWTTFTGIAFITALAVTVWVQRRRRPLVSLGLALYLGCHLLTGTILPLELIYEHRNYFASFGLLLAVVPLLASPSKPVDASPPTTRGGNPRIDSPLPLALPRYVLLVGLALLWALQTALTAYAWGNPLRLAYDLAARAPQSPRAQYELGRTYIIYSHYDPSSPFVEPAYTALEKAAALPESSILPEQALIFMNARMHLPLKDAWWTSMINKLKARRPGVQDESSLGALTQCAHEKLCDLPQEKMVAAFIAALSHSPPSARLLSMYGDYAWNVLGDQGFGLQMEIEATKASPREPAYLITMIRMLVAQGHQSEARKAVDRLRSLNIGGRLDKSIEGLNSQLQRMAPPSAGSVTGPRDHE